MEVRLLDVHGASHDPKDDTEEEFRKYASKRGNSDFCQVQEGAKTKNSATEERQGMCSSSRKGRVELVKPGRGGCPLLSRQKKVLSSLVNRWQYLP